VIFSSLAPYDVGMPWDEARERWTELMLDELERVLPGVRDRRTFTEVATPLTFERYTLNQRGAIYGWDHILSQCTPKRLPQLTPVPGLYLAGHWTDPGGSSFRCMFSGFVAAALLLGHRNLYALLEVLAGGAR
jgi:prolycopene isomerase